MLEQLLDSISVSGNEQEIAEKIAVLMQPIADKIVQDEMNNTICIINPDSPRRIMLSAHVDEVGLAVTSILRMDGSRCWRAAISSRKPIQAIR